MPDVVELLKALPPDDRRAGAARRAGLGVDADVSRTTQSSCRQPGLVKVPLAYPIARHDQAFATFINTWIDLKKKDGTLESLYRYWILGRTPTPAAPRWSVIRDVLHWVE